MGSHTKMRAFPVATGAIAIAALAAAPAAATVEFKLEGSQTIASPGDVITFEFWVDHDWYGVAGGNLDFLIRGVSDVASIDTGTSRDNFAQAFRNVGTDIPYAFDTTDQRVQDTPYAQAAGYDDWDFVISGERPTQSDLDWLTTSVIPPAFTLPWRSYELDGAIYTFDVVYEGGTLEVVPHSDGTFSTYADSTSVQSDPRDVINAPVWTVVPAPASLGVLAMVGALALRRRRH